MRDTYSKPGFIRQSRNTMYGSRIHAEAVSLLGLSLHFKNQVTTCYYRSKQPPILPRIRSNAGASYKSHEHSNSSQKDESLKWEKFPILYKGKLLIMMIMVIPVPLRRL